MELRNSLYFSYFQFEMAAHRLRRVVAHQLIDFRYTEPKISSLF